MNLQGREHVTMSNDGIYFPEMTPDQVRLKEVAHCSSKICRYNGFVRIFYSVAEHQLLCKELAEMEAPNWKELHRHALLHDAAEAYIGDISTPLKKLLPDYRKIEEHVEECVRVKFDLRNWSDWIWLEVKRIDKQAFFIEGTHILYGQYPDLPEIPEEIYEACPTARRLRDRIEIPHGAAAQAFFNAARKLGVNDE